MKTALNIRDIEAMTSFRRKPTEFMRRLKKTGRPLVLTVNGRAEAVIQNAEAYQRLLDLAALADEREGTRQGLADLKAGRVRSADRVFEEFRRRHGLHPPVH